jgi:23S rRNA (uracil1939-C5)-methyltransferase
MKGESYLSGRIERIAANGAGVLRDQGAPVFVHGAAPGELVVCKKNAGEERRAELVDIIESAPERTEAGCPAFGRCGGCSLRHLRYDAQLRIKTEMLRAAFSKAAGADALPEIAIYPSPPDGYRDRAQFHVAAAAEGAAREDLRGFLKKRAAGDAPRLGFMARDSRVVVPLDDCPVLNATLRGALSGKELRAPVDKDRFTVYGRQGTLVWEGGARRERFSFYAGGAPETLSVDAGLFFQSNGVLLERLIERLLEAASAAGDLPAGDFYAGCGTFAAFLRRRFSRLDILEEKSAALDLARENAPAAVGQRFRFFALSDSEWARRHGKNAPRYGFLCVDPGRQGLSPLFRRWVCGHPIETLAYISCESSALARDSRELLCAGFHLETLDFFDFYPQTPRIEALAVFQR